MSGPITSAKNPSILAVARLHRLRHRREEGLTVIEGPQVIDEALAAGVAIRQLYGLGDSVGRDVAARAGVELRAVTESVLAKISGTETPRGPVAVVQIPPSVLPQGRRLLVAWGVGDPGNCGTLLRTAAAFEYGFVAGPGSADPWSPKVLRSAAGGHFRTSVGSVTTPDELDGHPLVGTVARGGVLPSPLPPAAALIVGSESHGLPADLVQRCEQLVTIPMPGGAESLNAAVAGSIAAYLGAVSPQD